MVGDAFWEPTMSDLLHKPQERACMFEVLTVPKSVALGILITTKLTGQGFMQLGICCEKSSIQGLLKETRLMRRPGVGFFHGERSCPEMFFYG